MKTHVVLRYSQLNEYRKLVEKTFEGLGKVKLILQKLWESYKPVANLNSQFLFRNKLIQWKICAEVGDFQIASNTRNNTTSYLIASFNRRVLSDTGM